MIEGVKHSPPLFKETKMARCEDFPCCGHEMGCCPDFDQSGRQLNMICVCGARLSINNRSSICNGCLNDDEDNRDAVRHFDEDDEPRSDDFDDGDVDADFDASEDYHDDLPYYGDDFHDDGEFFSPEY